MICRPDVCWVVAESCRPLKAQLYLIPFYLWIKVLPEANNCRAMSCFQSKRPLKKISAVLVKADFQNELFHGHIAHAYSLENWVRFGKIWQLNRDRSEKQASKQSRDPVLVSTSLIRLLLRIYACLPGVPEIRALIFRWVRVASQNPRYFGLVFLD